MKKLCVFIIALNLLAMSCDQNEIEGLDNKTPLPSSIANLEYEDLIGTWNVLELCKDGESNFTSLETNSQNMLVFNNEEIKVSINLDYGNNKKFREECSFIKYNSFEVVDGVIYGYLKPEDSMRQLMFKIMDMNADTGIITIKNEQTRSSYKISKRNSTPDDTNNDDDNTVTPSPALYSTYEDFKGTWDVLELCEKGKSVFSPVDNSYTNSVIFDENDIDIKITLNHEGGKAFGEFGGFNNFTNLVVDKGSIFGYSEKGTSMAVFTIIDIDVESKIVTIKNESTKSTYKMIKQN